MDKVKIFDPYTYINVAHRIGLTEELQYLHAHDNYEIFVSLSNENKFFVRDKTYSVNKNDIFLFNNYDVHKINVANGEIFERYVLSIPKHVFDDENADVKRLLNFFNPKFDNYKVKLNLDDEKFHEVIDILEAIIDCQSNKYKNIKIKSYLIILLCKINEYLNNEAELIQYSSDTLINDVEQYLNSNCESQITLDMLSQKFYLNKYYLCRRFKEKTGFNISQYIEVCRLTKAIDLLQKGMNISNVASETGFGSDTYFITVFKKNFGTSPKKYFNQVINK